MKKLFIVAMICFIATGCAGRVFLDARLPDNKDIDIQISTKTEPDNYIVTE